MKRTKCLITLTALVISLITLHSSLFTHVAEGHLVGQPPFFKVNGTYTNLYPVPLTSLYNFELPQDLAPDNYLVNQTISFELDRDKLPAPSQVIDQTKFSWELGDETHTSGLKVSHAYAKIGSYILKIYADDKTTPEPQLLESVLINVLPDKNYQLPQSVIKVNGQVSKDPLVDILNFSFQKPLSFDAASSKSSSPIMEYFWDFGDQKSAIGATQTHSYPSDLSQVFVVLRIKTADGFISDSFVEIQNQDQAIFKTNKATPSAAVKKAPSSQLTFNLGGLAIVAIIVFMVQKYALGLGHGKR